MKNRTSLMFVVSTIAAALALAGCSATDNGASTGGEGCLPTSPQKVAEWCPGDGPLDIVVIQGTSEHSFYNTVGIGARAAGEELGVNVDVQGAAEFSPTAQASIINAVIESKPDAIIIALTSPTALDPQLVAAAEAGIMVFTVDNDTDNKDLRWTNVGTDHVKSGNVLAEVIAANVADAEVGVLASSPGPLVERLRIEGFTEGIESAGDGLTVLETQYCEGDAAKCNGVTNAIVTANPGVKAIMAVGEQMGIGAGNAVRAAGLVGDVLVGSFDASPSQQRDLKDGTVQALVVQHPYQMGYEAISIVSQYLNGGVITSPLLDGEVAAADLPDPIYAEFDIAVSDEALCPADLAVYCGTADDPKIQESLYVG
ncbi:MAG: substrate-binding domain-containing protein [Microbacteriaceae bacterium]